MSVPPKIPAILNRGWEQISARKTSAPDCRTFREFLTDHARVLQRDGSGGPFSLQGRAPIALVVD